VARDADTTAAQEAMAKARRAAAQARAGAEPDRAGDFEAEPVTEITEPRLAEWALIAPDPERVRSTRRLGAPITWAKRALMRAMRQYNDQVVAQQSRFNAHVGAHLVRLDERVSALERELDARRSQAGGDSDS
jgi:hypothetical protein